MWCSTLFGHISLNLVLVSRGLVGQVRVLDHTFANSVYQTASHIFYGIAAAENLLVFVTDVSNAFGKVPPPKQGFFIHLDWAF